ncbi:TPA: hypothetical protein EYN98_12300 [Candidatus Poribacteria bacterium]|nr:hypothetical protein [Candidatus Poribacteria bacterium]
MIDGSFRLTAEPLPIVTFPGKVCGCLKDGNWRGHTDGLSRIPFLESEGKTASIWLTFADIGSSGGATTLIPGSHCLIEKMAADPEFRAKSYTAEDNLDGLNWNPKEITLKAGGVFSFMIRPYTVLRTICCNNPDLFVRMVLLKEIKKKS